MLNLCVINACYSGRIASYAIDLQMEPSLAVVALRNSPRDRVGSAPP